MLPDTEEQLRGRGIITSSKDSADLEPETARMVDLAEAIMAARGVKGARTSGRRTDREQMALYAQGRRTVVEVNSLRGHAGLPPIDPAENAYTVTECDGIAARSPHQDGRAMDYVPVDSAGRAIWPVKTDPRWAAIAACFEAAGLMWGGRWKQFPDFPHYERSLT